MERWRAKPGVTNDQLAEAAKGGPSALEKVATLVSKQDKTVEHLSSINESLKKTLSVKVENFPEGGSGDDAPSVDEGNREG